MSAAPAPPSRKTCDDVKNSRARKRRGTDVAPTEAWARRTIDALTGAALATIFSLVSLLAWQTSYYPDFRPSLLAILVGLIASSLLLLRHWQRARNAERASRARAEYRLKHDLVTRLPNAEGFIEAITHLDHDANGDASEIAILCIRLERLADIHNRLGDACGDDLLRELAGRLTSAFGQDGVVARLGEDTLALMHPASGSLKAALIAGEINQMMDRPVLTPVGDVAVTSRIGVNFVTGPITSPKMVVRQARLAAAAADATDAAVAFFDPSLDHAQRFHLDLEIDLRRALQDGLLDMVYQPQIDETGGIIGAEALMRWPHPTRGAVSPTVFVPLAEAAGLGERLGRYALEHAFADSRQWSDLKIAINVSPIQLKCSTFADMVRTLLVQYGVRASGFELEITEGVLLCAEPSVLNNLEQLRRMGFRIALDDFGTGYCSLGYLSRLPVDKIKIDRSFVMPLGERKDATMIIRAISDLSVALGVELLAEGVETRAQLDILRAEGCNQAQGHLIGHPMSPDQFTALLSQSRDDQGSRHRLAA